jgi:hypothetical protein
MLGKKTDGLLKNLRTFLCKIAEIFGRPSPSPSPRTSLKSAESDFENTSDSDSDSACLFVYAFILLKSQHFTKKINFFFFKILLFPL